MESSEPKPSATVDSKVEAEATNGGLRLDIELTIIVESGNGANFIEAETQELVPKIVRITSLNKNDDITAAEKKMTRLMDRLSQLIEQDEEDSKRDLMSCAKDIIETSDEVARFAKELARECRDERMQMGLLQVCERIPTIGTQLRILSTVKIAKLGVTDGEENHDATDTIIGNAENLVQSVRDTLRAAEAVSIKIRTDAGICMKWVRRPPWYHC